MDAKEDESVERSHILCDKGMPAVAGCRFEFHIEVCPPTRVTVVEFQGNVDDVVGFNERPQHVFVLNKNKTYSVYTDRPCTRIVMKTAVLKEEDKPISIRPYFKTSFYDSNEDVLSLADRLRLSNPDFRIKLNSGQFIPIHQTVLRANSGYFDSVIEWKKEVEFVEADADFTDNTWSAAVRFMYDTDVDSETIEELQELLVLGNKYLVKDLSIVAARRLKALINDSCYENVTPYLISVMHMVADYKSTADDRLQMELHDMMNCCKSFMHSNCHQLWKERDFVIEYAKFLEAHDEVKEGERTPMLMLGKRKWTMPDI